MKDELAMDGKSSSENSEAGKQNRSARPVPQKIYTKKRKAPEKQESETAAFDGGVLMTTSEILDFSEGADS